MYISRKVSVLLGWIDLYNIRMEHVDVSFASKIFT